MSWQNYGDHWHIDHVIPIKKFNTLNDDEANICFNWRNVTPMRADENMKKKANIDLDQLKIHKDILAEYEEEFGYDELQAYNDMVNDLL